MTTESQQASRTFIEIKTAAKLAGCSVRHFRRIIDTERIVKLRIGRKLFILAKDFESWQAIRVDK